MRTGRIPSREEFSPVVGGGWVHNNVENKIAGTLLGPEATPVCCRLAWWWGVVFELWIVVASI
ncbi:hypothetical protein MBRA_40630 [Mycobacterium branderi]|uniref:Uncharacterized protein n=1 Tax=Mycobacterium branderi TaxID=43348 RepID=A0ABM7KS20_9MYCO|nr:hypothetical protein MBRA_31010 [Mycobacterium branderi]BBZ13868.1 hypothetical protein MBRA_40630 [Mycobacterium branderi]